MLGEDSQFIPALLGQTNPDNKPFAEYWMGAHDNAPADLIGANGQKQPLECMGGARPCWLYWAIRSMTVLASCLTC